MKPYWYPQPDWDEVGYTKSKFVLTEGTKKQIQEDLKVRRLGGRCDWKNFFLTVESAISHYRFLDLNKNSCSPAQIRKKLRAAITSAKALIEKFDTFDRNTMLFIRFNRIDRLGLFYGSIHSAVLDLQKVLDSTDQFPKSGRLPCPHKITLAVDIATAMHNHLGVRPTTTKGGPFESTLEILLEAGGDRKVKAINDLARKAVCIWERAENPD